MENAEPSATKSEHSSIRSVGSRVGFLHVRGDVVRHIKRQPSQFSCHELDQLCEQWKERTEIRISLILGRLEYKLADTDAITLATDSARLELSVMPLVYVLLKQQVQLLKTPSSPGVAMLPEGIIYTWEVLFTAISQRVRHLAMLWRVQRLDVDVHMMSFCGGLFEHWYTEVLADDRRPTCEDDVTSDEDDLVSTHHYGD